jgi:hypothetical protein
MTKKTKNEKKVKLGKLIEQTSPEWLTPELFQKYTKQRSTLRHNADIKKYINDIFEDLDFSTVIIHPNWKSYSFGYSPKVLVQLYLEDRLFSEPGSGQDPKIWSTANYKTAAFHAGRHWGWDTNIDKDGNYLPSNPQWIENGTFNIVHYPNGKVVLEPCNVEHRLWGLIGFPLNLVPIDAKHDLWFYHTDLPELYDEKSNTMIRRIKVNGMFLEDIVQEAELNGARVTEDEVLNSHYYKNNFSFTILPFYSKEECELYFREVNTTSAKSRAQLFHSESDPIMAWVKSFSSPKCVKFKPLKCNYHPLFELLPELELVKLEAMMYSYLVIDYISRYNKPVDSTDHSLIRRYEETNGYANKFANGSVEEFKDNVVELLDYIYDLVSSHIPPVGKAPIKLSRQLIQQLLQTRQYLLYNGYIIQDNVTFINEFYEFYKEEQEDGDKLTSFGRDVRSGSSINASEAFKTTRKVLLKDITDINHLKTIGVVPAARSLKRLFSQEVISDNLEMHNGLDIDDALLTTKPVGGHIISDMELIRMTEDERDQAFKDMGLGETFDFDKNCRAMSSYHNQRMGVLTLPEYLAIYKAEDAVVKAAVIRKYDSLKKKKVIAGV